jgi:hypothetical protein
VIQTSNLFISNLEIKEGRKQKREGRGGREKEREGKSPSEMI